MKGRRIGESSGNAARLEAPGGGRRNRGKDALESAGEATASGHGFFSAAPSALGLWRVHEWE